MQSRVAKPVNINKYLLHNMIVVISSIWCRREFELGLSSSDSFESVITDVLLVYCCFGVSYREFSGQLNTLNQVKLVEVIKVTYHHDDNIIRTSIDSVRIICYQ